MPSTYHATEDSDAAKRAIECLQKEGIIMKDTVFKGRHMPTRKGFEPVNDANPLDSVWVVANWLDNYELVINRTLGEGNYASTTDVPWGKGRAAVGCVKAARGK